MFIIMNKREYKNEAVRAVNCVLFFCFVYAPFSTFAQVEDAGLWTSVNIEKKITTDFSVELSEELRFNENISELGTVFTEVGGDYKLIKHVTVGASYRFIQRRRVDDFYSLRHRYTFTATLRYKIKKMAINLRERYVTQYADINTSEDGKIPQKYLGSKLTLKYDLEKKYTPFLYTELFYNLSIPEGNDFDNVRYAAGFEYEFNKKNSIELSYLVNKEFNVNNPLTSYVIEIAYNFILPDFKSKSEEMIPE